jgi:hypothetical protein
MISHVIAAIIGWAQSPFQLELAFASLGLGVAAILVHGQRPDLTGAAGGHLYVAWNAYARRAGAAKRASRITEVSRLAAPAAHSAH